MAKKSESKLKPKKYYRGSDDYGIADLEIMADELRSWSLLKGSLRLYDYPLSLDITPRQFSYYIERNENLKNAWELARARIASRRDNLALEGRINTHYACSTQGIYDDDFRANMRDKRARDDDESKQIVIIERYPSTDKVPDKK